MNVPALIFDCDGVLADTERDGHRPAFNRAFAELGVPLGWDESQYAAKVRIGGGKERIRAEFTPAYLDAHPEGPQDEAGISDLIARLHRRKTDIYTEMITGGTIEPRPGVVRLAAQAHAAGWQLAVASTSAEPSVRAVLERVVGADLAAEFAVFAGDIVAAKKPAPDIYLHALASLGVGASEAVVVEDSAIGLRAARGAGLRTVVTVSGYTADEDFSGAVLVLSSLGDHAAGAPVAVLADPNGLAPVREITLQDIENVLRTTPVPAVRHEEER